MFYRERHVISVDDFTPADLEEIFDEATIMKTRMASARERMRLKHTLIDEHGQPREFVTLFWKASTRTKISSGKAVEALGGRWDKEDNAGEFSSIAKGEALRTSVVILAQYYDGIFIRYHGEEEGVMRIASDASEMSSEYPESKVPSIINAGDRNHEHPTQTLIDLYIVREYKPGLFNKGALTWAFMGDLRDSRTIHSAIVALGDYGGRVYVVSYPDNDLPPWVYEKAAAKGLGITRLDSWESIAREVDVWYLVRSQEEYRSDGGRRLPDYARRFGAHESFLERIHEDAIILHPLPHGPEIQEMSAFRDKRFVYIKQAYNGLPLRAALLKKLFETREARI